MNNKGFTLVELLAVIVILALLALLTSTTVTKLVKDSKSDLSNIQIASIKASAEIWGSENLERLPGDGECAYITLKDLQNNGLIDDNVVEPSTTEQISNELKIKITGESTSKGKIIYTYEVNPDSVTACIDVGEICIAVSTSTKTTGNVPLGNYTPGDEYVCEVSPEKYYTFFVLSTNDDSVNLIMDSNITRDGYAIKNNDYIDDNNTSNWHTAWVTESDYKDAGGTIENIIDSSFEDKEGTTATVANDLGPITALKYLKEATKNWEYVGSNNIRLPKKQEINNIFIDKAYSMDKFELNKLPLWAINYLYNGENHSDWKTTAIIEGRTSIRRLGCYWVAEKKIFEQTKYSTAYDVGADDGYYGATNVYADSSIYVDGPYTGVRPVMSLKKSQMPTIPNS